MEALDAKERRAVARKLRRRGESIRSIADQLGVAKSSVSLRCRDIALTPEQREKLSDRARAANRQPRNTQWKRHRQIAAIESAAAGSSGTLAASPLWAAGVALYWAEGSKTERRLSMANADPDLLRLFMRWVTEFHKLSEFSCSINLHANNDEAAARVYWARQLGIPTENFTKTYIKPDGNGHRKNHLEYGVARVSPRKSTDAWITTMAWIANLSAHL
jgi:hypothetical protein